jgi:hypothetical protein
LLRADSAACFIVLDVDMVVVCGSLGRFE